MQVGTGGHSNQSKIQVGINLQIQINDPLRVPDLLLHSKHASELREDIMILASLIFTSAVYVFFSEPSYAFFQFVVLAGIFLWSSWHVRYGK